MPWTKDANAIISPDARVGTAGFDSTDYVSGVLDGSTWKGFYSAVWLITSDKRRFPNQAQLTLNPLNSMLTAGHK